MPNLQVILITPRWRLVFGAWVLGVCFFYFSGISRVLALDSASPLFQQNRSDTVAKEKNGQPLALPEESSNPSPGLFSTFLRLVVALAVTAGLIFATVWGLRLIWEKRTLNNLSDENKPIKILTSTYLAPRKAIHLIEVGNRILVVGVGANEVNCLDVVTEAAEVESLRRMTQQNFPTIFNRLIHKDAIEERERETDRAIADSNKVVGDYVKGLKKTHQKKKEEHQGSGEEK